MAIFDNITARKRAEEELVRRERELATVYDSAPVVMVVLDEERRVRRANRAALDVTGDGGHTAVPGLRGGEALRCVHALDDPRGCGFGPACQNCAIHRMVLDTLQTGSSHYREEQQLVVERGGREMTLHLLASSVRMSLDDRPHVLVSVEDVTEQRVAQRQLRQREVELAHLSRLHTVGQMAATLAHELNQPLYAMNNYVHGVQRRLRKKLAAEDLNQVVDAMEHVSQEVGRAAGIVTHLREFVRGRNPRRSSVDLGRLLRQAVELMQPLSRDQGVSLELAPTDALPVVQADPIHVEQIVVNLLANAIEAVSGLPAARRRVTIAARVSDRSAVEIVVRDCGPGIAADVRERLFEAFVTTKPNGLGMGLAISRSLVQSHGGRIWALANEPHGAAFYFTLPLEMVN